MTPPASDPIIPLPQVTPESQGFWDGCRRGELVVQRCRTCDAYVHIPQAACTACLSDDLYWTPSSGRGTVYTFSTLYRAPGPAFTTPHIVVTVQMDEGYLMLSNLIDVDPDAITIDMPVEVVFEPVDAEITLPKFRPRRPAP